MLPSSRSLLLSLAVGPLIPSPAPADEPPPTLSRADDMLTIRGPRLPGGELMVRYLEAHCRPGSSDRDRGGTLIPNATQPVRRSPDGRRLGRRRTLADGVTVDHALTAGRDEVDLRLAATNPAEEESGPCRELSRGVIAGPHSDLRSGGLQPGETRRIRGGVYLVGADGDALLPRHRADLPEHRSGPIRLDPDAARPPVTKRVPEGFTLHGATRTDDYSWLREKSDPAVIAHLEAENGYTAAVLKPTEPLQETLYGEMRGRLREDDADAPYRLGEDWYYARTEPGKQYPIRCRKRVSLEAPEQVILDLNEQAEGQKGFSLRAFELSEDGRLLAFSTDATGFREYTLRIKDLRTGAILPDRAERVGTVAWAADSRTLLYVTEDAAKRPYRLYRHALGGGDDELVYEEKDEHFRLRVAPTRDRRYLIISSTSWAASEARLLPSDRPRDPPRVVLPRREGWIYAVEHRAGRLYLRLKEAGSEFRILTTPAADPRPGSLSELFPLRGHPAVEGLDLFAHHAVVCGREGGLPALWVLDLDGGAGRRIAMPEPLCSVKADANPEFDATTYRFRCSSYLTPESTYDLDLATGTLALRKRAEVRGYDPAAYDVERCVATAPDGERIPISMVYRKDARRAGPAPLLLEGYGAYGFSSEVDFDPDRLSLLDRGVIFARAHVRGGGEFGRRWHDAGRLRDKTHTFTDFIAAADHLVGAGYTTRDRLAIHGRSAGGLLIGAVLNRRPDLCRAAVPEVPFVDVLGTLSDRSLPLTVTEHQEWGDPRDPSDYPVLHSYCPYTNLSRRDYPAVLVLTALNDSQVMYWEPAKYAARLRALRTDTDPTLLHVAMAGGHGGASGRYDALRETALMYAFVLAELGVAGESPPRAR
jgi:oligopeptidase B